MAGMRDLIAHAYFDVDLEIGWDVVSTKLGPLETGVRLLQGRRKALRPRFTAGSPCSRFLR